MIESVLFTPEADDDIGSSYRWYENCEQGLGEEFLRCVEATLTNIQRHPELYRTALDEFRRAFIRRFPFEIFYELEGNSVIIYAVFHCSQDPEKWQRRITKRRA